MRSLLGRFRRPISRSQLEKIGTMVLDGDGSTLSLDFTTMSGLDSRFTFSRASTTATFINSSGLVTTAGTNVPRFDYDPSTLAPRGLLIEGSATNLLTYSEDFNAAAWTDTSITRATGNADPGGGTTAVRFTASAGNATVIRAAAIGTSAERTFSVWLRRVTGTGNIQYTQNNGTNWTTQAITSTWTRYTFTHTVDHRVGIRIVTSGDAIEMWGAQLEAGSGASSYIPTGASTVQRAADSCAMTGTNFSSWYPAGTTSGTFFCQFDNSRSNLGFAINPTPIALGEYSAGNLIAGLMNTTVVGSGATISVWGSGGSGLQQAAIGATISQGNKIAFAFNGQTATGSLNGGSGTATTTGTVNSKTILFIGGSGSGSSLVRDYIVAPIQRIKFFPSVFSTAQLQSLTQ